MSIVVVVEVLVIAVVGVAIVVVFGVVIVNIKPSWQDFSPPPPFSGNAPYAPIYGNNTFQKGASLIESLFLPAFLYPVARVTLIKSPKHFSFFSFSDDYW